ncbi:hypothetical protein KCU71_g9368, partial [Aureobasidium melanogenum]
MPRFLLRLPNELIKRVVDYLDRESILKFRATFFTYRCHALSKESMLTLIHILKHPEFGSHIQTLAFNAILPAMNSAIFNWDNAPWGNQDERWLESDTSPQLSQSGTPEFVDISPPPGSPHPPAIFQLPESAFLITSGTNFGMYMFHVTELFEKLQRPIDTEINDHALDDKIKPPAFIMKVGWNTMGFLQMMKVPVGKLSVDLTSHAQGIGLLGLLHLACFFHDILAGNTGLNLKKELALRLAFGRNGAIENSSDYDPKAGILHLYGINIWHRDLDRNPTPWAAWITEAILDLSGCAVPNVGKFLDVIAFRRTHLQRITISDTHLESDTTWASIIHLLASIKALKYVLFVNLTSMASSGPLDTDMVELVDIVSFEHEGPDLDVKLTSLAVNVEAARATRTALHLALARISVS